MSINGRALNPQYLHLYKKCIASYRNSMIDLAARRYPECILSMYEALEFFWKAIYFLNNGRYPHNHLPSLTEFNSVSSLLQKYLSNNQISNIRAIFRVYNPRWRSNPQQRMRPRYGDEVTGIPPARLYKKRNAEIAVLRSSILAKQLVDVHRQIMLQQPKLLVGVLSGYFSNSHNEYRCNQAPSASGVSAKKWQTVLSTLTNVKVNLKTISQLDNSLSCVINPFGEAYPEKTTVPSTLPAYELIKDYVFFGGIFVNCGGMPLTYFFDVTSGGPLNNTSTVLNNYPVGVQISTAANGLPQLQILATTVLVNNLCRKDLGIMPLMDDPKSGRVGPFASQLHQTVADRKFWNYTEAVPMLMVFRPIDPQASPNAVPVMRTTVSGMEFYPISFVRYGFGIFFSIGLDLNVGRNSECSFAKDSVKNLLQNYRAYF
jgi:HEPN domain-containing protein